MIRLLWVSALLLVSAQCVRHVYPYNHKIREYRPDAYAAPDAARTPGSLWSEGARNMFEDTRARRIGDILTVRVAERADATRDTGTAMQRESDAQYGVSSFWTAMGTLTKQFPGLDPNSLLAAANSSNFRGSGNTTRSGQVSAILPVRIKDAMPNGDFFVEGNKVLLLNDEESFLYISGVVRPLDIAPDNSVDSGSIADVEMEYTGRGVLSENENAPWLKRILNYLWPL